MVPGQVRAEFNLSDRVTSQDDPATLQAPHSGQTLTINNGNSTTFGGTISGQLNLTAGNTVTGTAQDHGSTHHQRGPMADQQPPGETLLTPLSSAKNLPTGLASHSSVRFR